MSGEKNYWPCWNTGRLIGRGSFGEVYEIQRDVFGEVEKAALKVISIPQNGSDIDEMYGEGYDDESITSTFKSHLQSIVAEYTLMRKISSRINVVHCDDIRYEQHDDGFGWDIFIKMELLTPLMKAITGEITEELVLKVGRDICNALTACKEFGIVHRDIKPQNIFVSKYGDYKLGDFGIAKTVEKTMGGTKIGTYKYMAPEVYNNQPYGSTADIYSLGLVLYWLLNERRMPFLPMPPAKMTMGMEEQARLRRFKGEELPEPKNGSEALKRIVLKACSYDPKSRFASAEDMLAALNIIGTKVEQSHVASMPKLELKSEPEMELETESGPVSSKVELPFYTAHNQPMEKGNDTTVEEQQVGQVRLRGQERAETECLTVEWQEKDPHRREYEEFCRAQEWETKQKCREQVTPELQAEAKKQRKIKTGRILLASIALACTILGVRAFVLRPHWKTEDGQYRYLMDGKSLTGWQTIDGGRYYFGADGIMSTGLQEVNGNKYYFGMDGVVKTGWQTISGKKYFFDDIGIMKTGLQEMNGHQYYFGTDGVLKTGLQDINGNKYYLGSEGFIRTSWQNINGDTFYFDDVGTMKTGWQVIDGKKYHFQKSGQMLIGKWKIGDYYYHFNDMGVMTTGAADLKNGEVYYFDENGVFLYKDITLNELDVSSSESKLYFDNSHGSQSSAHAQILSQPLNHVYSVSLKLTITDLEYGSADGRWQMRVCDTSGKWKKIGSFDVKDGSGVFNISFDKPIEFEQYICTSYATSAWSGKFLQEITELAYRDYDYGSINGSIE